VVKAPPKIIPLNRVVAPTVIPRNIAVVKDEAPTMYVNDGGVLGGTGSSVLGSLMSNTAAPPPPPKPVNTAPVRVGGNVAAANLIQQVPPVYPPIAKTAHISGTVVLHAIISKDGTIDQLEYQSGPPLLMKAAMDAVKQWRYRPTMLNGEPVDVDTTISVIFTLG